MKDAELEQMMKLVGRSDVATEKQHAGTRGADPRASRRCAHPRDLTPALIGGASSTG